MEKVSEVFFSEHGLTSTSASHLADLAHSKEKLIPVFKQSGEYINSFSFHSRRKFHSIVATNRP